MDEFKRANTLDKDHSTNIPVSSLTIPNCRVCGLPSYGAIQMPAWKKNKRGKVMTNILGEPVLDYYELWYYCKDHYEIFGATNKILDGYIAGLDKIIEKKIQDRYDAINALFSFSQSLRQRRIPDG